MNKATIIFSLFLYGWGVACIFHYMLVYNIAGIILLTLNSLIIYNEIRKKY